MSQERARRHDMAVYFILLLLAVIAAIIGLLSLKEHQSLQSLLLNISTELAGAALIFFILKYFALDESGTNSIEQKINKISNDTELIKKSTNVQSSVELQKQLNTLQESVGHLTSEFGKLSDRVLAEFSSQQKDLMQTLQAQFRQHIENSRDTLERAITKELATIVPASSTQKASKVMTEHIGHAIYAMAQFQSVVLEREIQSSLERASSKVTKKVQEVGKEVKTVQTQIESLQSLLPAPSKYRKDGMR